MAEWDQRQLCPDGACVGVIGPDGTCRMCGRAAPGWGDERQRGLLPPSDSADEGDEDEDDLDDDAEDDLDDDAAPADPIAPGTPVAIGAWSGRELCSDGACTGVIGADGRCKVCGKPGERGDRVAPGSSEEAELAAAAADLAAVAPADAIADLTETSDEEPARSLCPDGACVGVIGDDGRCKVCGKEAA